MKAMILAAGRGERMRPLTDHTPKPLLEVAGKPLIEHHLDALARAGFTEVVVNIAHLGARIRAALGERHGATLRIHYSDEGGAALETGGGILHALPLLGEQPFLVINGDVWCERPLEPLVPSADDLAHLVLVDNPPHCPDGDLHLHAGRIRNEGVLRLTYSGIGYYRPQLFRGCRPGPFPLAPLLRAAAAQNRLGGERYRGQWLDVGTPERLAALNALLGREGYRPPRHGAHGDLL